MKKILVFLFILNCLQHAIAQDTSVRYNQYGQPVGRLPLLTESRDGVLVFESKAQDYRLWFDIRVQADAQMFIGNTYNPIGNGATISGPTIAPPDMLQRFAKATCGRNAPVSRIFSFLFIHFANEKAPSEKAVPSNASSTFFMVVGFIDKSIFTATHFG